MRTICDRCDKCEVVASGTATICHAFIERQTRFTRGITKDYIEERMIGEKNNCKEFKRIYKTTTT